MKKIGMVFLLPYLVSATGCASIVSWINEGGIDQQEVFFTSDPLGVELYSFDNIKLGETPLTVKIQRVKSAPDLQKTKFTAKKKGYEDQTFFLRYELNPWFWGNVIGAQFGVLLSTTDYANDAIHEYDPDQYFITLKKKSASFEDSQRLKARMKIRNFILNNYYNIGFELARGEGEYILSLYQLLDIKNRTAQRQSLGQIRKIYKNSRKIPDFATEVLEQLSREAV